MRVEITRHIDASEQNSDGFYDWYYEYYLYRFFDNETELLARSYRDEPNKAQILSIKINGDTISLTSKELLLPIFSATASQLRTEGKSEISWLSETGYVSL